MNVLLADVLQTDLSHHRRLYDFFHNEVVQVALALIAIVVIQLILRDLIARILHRAVRRQRYTTEAEAQKRATTVTQVCQTASGGIIWIIGGIMILGILHVNIAALATGAGLVSVIIGLSAQNTIKDFMSGMFIILENQYGVGDIITVRSTAGIVSGKVEELTIRITKLRDLDGALHVVTNGAGAVISNNTARYSNIKMSIHLPYTVDVDKIRTIIDDVGLSMTKEEEWAKQILEPISFWRIDSFEDFAVGALMFGKVKAGSQYDVSGEFRGRLLKAFKEHKIEVPLSIIPGTTSGQKPARR